MKVASVLLTLAMGAMAKESSPAATNSVRGVKEATGTTRPDASGKSSPGRQKRKERLERRNALHKSLLNNEAGNADEGTGTGGGHLDLVKSLHKTLFDKTTDSAGEEAAGRNLAYKAKSYKSDDGSSSGSGSGSHDWDDDEYSSHSGKSGSGSSSGSYSGSGKSGKSGGGSGRSGKSGGYSGSGKSGKYSCGDEFYMTITNLSYEQSLSEIFIMVADEEVTRKRPMYIFGNRTTDALADLAQNADARELERLYDGRSGVEKVMIHDDFCPTNSDSCSDTDSKWMRGGRRVRIKVPSYGDGNRLSIAAGMPFTNDGVVVLQGEYIYNGAEYNLPAIDVGAEANIQTCWSVAAMQDDFPSRSICADNDFSDENDNNIPGENFVHLHRGMHDFDERDDFEDLFPYRCDELNVNFNDNDRFSQYFHDAGWDDWYLLGDDNAWYDDQAFIDNLNGDYDHLDDALIKIARNSNDFEEFCDEIDDFIDDLETLFETLEAPRFDWRRDVAQVRIHCDKYDGGRWERLSSGSSSTDSWGSSSSSQEMSSASNE